MNTPPKTYLGDSVYVAVERGMLKLTTENGDAPSNTIYLEFSVFLALLAFVERLETKSPMPRN